MGLRPPGPDLSAWRERAEALERDVYALSIAVRDPRTPLRATAVVGLVVAYAVSPVDPIPDVIPVVGYLDELVVLPAGVALALRLTPDDVLADCRERTDEAIDVGRVRWLVGVVVVLAWLAVVALLVRAVVGWP